MANEFGYAGRILKVDLSQVTMVNVPTRDYTNRFIGGRGVAAKIYWDEVPPRIKALDPENQLIFMTGPMAGYSGVAGSMCQVCGKSPATNPEQFCYSSLGGSWGAYLKFAGYDGIVIYGKSEKPVYLIVQDDVAQLRDASDFWGKDSVEVRYLLKCELGNSARVLAIGPAGEHLVPFATILADEDASCWGFAAVMGAKNLKAIVVRQKFGRPTVANRGKLKAMTTHLGELFKGGAGIGRKVLEIPSLVEKRLLCYGCISGCDRVTCETVEGDKGKFFCQSAFYYLLQANSYYGERNEVPYHATKLCNRYGLDTHFMYAVLRWLSDCYQSGILTDKNTGITLSKFGSLEFIENLVKMISMRDGFGDVLAQGIYQAADSVGKKARDLITDYADKNGQSVAYGPRLYVINGLFLATEPRMALSLHHEITKPVMKWRWWVKGVDGAYMSGEMLRAIGRRFWGSELAFDFSTYEGKAMAAKKIQDRIYAIECLGLCGYYYPVTDTRYSKTHQGDPAIESELYSAITGNEVDEDELNKIGERVFNLTRAILTREGRRGRESDRLLEYNYTRSLDGEPMNADCLVPGKDGVSMSRKGAIVDREQFARMLNEYYELRGWDTSSGLQTTAKLEELNLEDIARELKKDGQMI
ncbi:aldehyde ferredoxin oxidoreductase N-terminal domain-containing protein [Chloroflexota bacterium]